MPSLDTIRAIGIPQIKLFLELIEYVTTIFIAISYKVIEISNNNQ